MSSIIRFIKDPERGWNQIDLPQKTEYPIDKSSIGDFIGSTGRSIDATIWTEMSKTEPTEYFYRFSSRGVGTTYNTLMDQVNTIAEYAHVADNFFLGM